MNTPVPSAYVGFPAGNAPSPNPNAAATTSTPSLFAHAPGASPHATPTQATNPQVRFTAPQGTGALTASTQASAGAGDIGALLTTATPPPGVAVVGTWPLEPVRLTPAPQAGAAAITGAGPGAGAAVGTGAAVGAEQPASGADARVPGTAPAPTRMTSVAPGGTARDADLVESTLGLLRQSPSGAQLVDRLLAVGARVNVVTNDDFARLGHATAHAFYDPGVKTIYLRRAELEAASGIAPAAGGAATPSRSPGFAAVALAHEGTHLLDDVSGVADGFIAARTRAIADAGGSASLAGLETQRQALFELTMVKEARAFTFAGQVARELGVTTPPSDPTSVAAAGPNDAATYGRVFSALLSSPYNPEGRSAALASF